MNQERRKHTVYPPAKDVFSWTLSCPIQKVNVVVIKLLTLSCPIQKVNVVVIKHTCSCMYDALSLPYSGKHVSDNTFANFSACAYWCSYIRGTEVSLYFPPICLAYYYAYTAVTVVCLQVKVVILGQDPYHGPNQAHGMCFSVRVGVAVPPSLRNMYKELLSSVDDFKVPDHGYLMGWAEQGVLLLNACLTVRQKEPNSHAGKVQLL